MLDDNFVQAKSFLAPAPENEIDSPLLKGVRSKIAQTERRMLNRVEVKLPVEVEPPTNNSNIPKYTFTEITDISEHGARLISNNALPSLDKIHICLPPSYPDGLIKTERIDSDVEVRWSHTNNGDNEFIYGVNFLNINEDKINRLKKIIGCEPVEIKRKKMHEIPKFGDRDYEMSSVVERLNWVSEITGYELKHVGYFSERPENMKGNIENLIGVCQIPLGIAGPLLVKGEHANGSFYVPMATTEGALLLSYHMGMKIVTLSGGARVKLINDSVHISPLFYVEDLLEAEDFIKWVRENEVSIKETAESTTKHGKLLSIEPVLMGRRVVLKFSYSTGDAQGLNMINKATEEACEFIERQTGKKHILRSHFSSIKQVSTRNIHCGQGKSVFAEAIIEKRKLYKLFGVTPQEVERYYNSAMLAGRYAGILGETGHAANAITAVFIACGQDVADVSVSHIGISMCEVIEDGNLYVSFYIPNLFVGTIGGGTGIGTQRECLEILGCYGTEKAKKFAEIIGATILAGEISVLAALVCGNYVNAHERYGRNRP